MSVLACELGCDVTQVKKGRIFKCPKCGMEYDRDLNALYKYISYVNDRIGIGCGSLEPPTNKVGDAH
ncbi:TPA: hypothetical protein EYP70_07755 [Candidatus Bathyarchaeota archaeon]|nr:hypothetical protein [Candidatus Bathyarchaeota archaeon]